MKFPVEEGAVQVLWCVSGAEDQVQWRESRGGSVFLLLQEFQAFLHPGLLGVYTYLLPFLGHQDHRWQAAFAAGDVGGGNEAAWDGTLNVGQAAG